MRPRIRSGPWAAYDRFVSRSRTSPHWGPGWVVLLGCAGVGALVGFLWLVEHTSPPPLASAVVIMAAVGALLLGPWAHLAARRLQGDGAANRILRRVVLVVGLLATLGVLLAATFTASGSTESSNDAAIQVAMFAFIIAGVLALIGVVLIPWLFLLARTVTRERAARVRAEERAAVASHLHDSVLQALTLIQKRAGDPGEVVRLARRSERELRGWLYGQAGGEAAGAAATGEQQGEQDLAAALQRAAAEVEDRHGVSVELVTVGTLPLDERGRAVVAAATEALTNAAKHAGTAHVSMFAEVADGEVVVRVRDRGRGFDQAAAAGPDRHGLADSIVGRMGRHGGTAMIRSAPGAGTEVELRLPVALGKAR
jgi:signal transduction histidine kinase